MINVKVRPDNSGFAAARQAAATEGQAAGAAYAGGIAPGMRQAGSAASSASSAVSGLASSSRALGLAALAVVPELTQLLGALLVIPGALGMAGAAAGTLKMALSGVGEALSAQEPAAQAAGSAHASMARQIRDATDAINDARRDQARAAEDSARSIADAERSAAESVASAKRSLEDAQRSYARAVRDAERSVQDAVRSTARAVQDAKRAQAQASERSSERISDALEREQDALDDLSEARRDAVKDVEDLQRRLSGYAADEQSAQAAVARAAEELTRTNASRRYSDVDRQEAAADLAQAEQRLRDIQADRAQDTAKLAAVEKGGIDATERVIDAQERLQDASEAVAEAREDGALSAEDAARRVADAEQRGAEAVASAQERLALAREDGARRLEDAENAVSRAAEDGARRVADAKRSAAEQQEQAAERVADALQQLADVEAQQAEQAAAGAGAVNAYADALAKLSPNARAFVEAIRELRPEWEALQRSVQDAAFAGLAQTARDLSDTYLPVLREGLGGIAQELNAMGIYAADALMSPEAVAAVNSVLEDTKLFLGESKTALGDFLVGLLELAAIGAEYLPGFGEGVADVAARFREWIATKEGRDQIKEWIEKAGKAFDLMWGICKDVYAILKNVSEALGIESGGGLLAGLKDLTGKLREVAESEKTKQFLTAVGQIVRWVADGLIWLVPKIVDAYNWFSNLGRRISEFADGVKAKLKGIWDGLAAGARIAVNGAIRVLNGGIQAVNWMIKAYNSIPLLGDLPVYGMFPYLARGGIAGGMAVVGEQGPELVQLPQGSRVFPAGQSAQMADRMAQQGGGSAGPLEVRFVGNTSDALATTVMQMIRTGRIQIRQSQLVAG